MDWKQRGEHLALITFISLLIGIGIIMAYYLYLAPETYFANENFLRRVEVLVAGLALIANIGLSGGLIYIYLNQNRVLRDEIAVLTSQQELMRSEQQPEITDPYDVQMFGSRHQDRKSEASEADREFRFTNTDWFPQGLEIAGEIKTVDDSISVDIGTESKNNERDPPKDGIVFRLSNTGGGSARRFQLWSWIIVHDGPHEGMWARSPLKRLDRYSLHEFADNTLKGGEQDVKFQGEVKLKIRDSAGDGDQRGEFGTYPFSDGVEKLVNEGAQEIEVILELRYEDTFDEEYENQFFNHRAPIEQGMDWIDFIKKEYPTVRYVNTSEQEQSWRGTFGAKFNAFKQRFVQLFD